MEKRSESDILAKAPIKVKLGDKEYKIPLLTVLPAREWRIKLNSELAGLTGSFKVVESADATAVANGMSFALIQFPETVADLLFAYAGDALPKDEVLAASTEEQLASAFSAVMQVAYPFLPQLATVTQVMRAHSPASARSTN